MFISGLTVHMEGTSLKKLKDSGPKRTHISNKSSRSLSTASLTPVAKLTGVRLDNSSNFGLKAKKRKLSLLSFSWKRDTVAPHTRVLTTLSSYESDSSRKFHYTCDSSLKLQVHSR